MREHATQGFDIVLERDFDSTACPIELVPQNMTRVLLNLIGNGFYAATSKCRAVGNGMRPRSGTNLFQPFFTTKPTGEGAGLGLSADGWIVTGYVFVWQIALTKCRATRPRGSPGLAQTLAPLAGNRGFESAPLQGRVRYEPDFGRPGSPVGEQTRRSRPFESDVSRGRDV